MRLTKNTDSRTEVEIYSLSVSPTEALSLVLSLTEQVKEETPNRGRLESQLSDGAVFTIAVKFDADAPPTQDAEAEFFRGLTFSNR